LGGHRGFEPQEHACESWNREKGQMDNRQKTWIWLGAAMSFVVGLLLLMNDSSAAGLFLMLIGISSLATLTRAGQTWAGSNPGLAKWGLIAIPVLVVLLAVIVGALFLLR
jgi:hypothetical protein